MPFSKLGLCHPIVSAIESLGYTTPTPIQLQAIPVILAGKDLIATAQTGTGKTAAFVLPILEAFNQERTLRGKRIRALILTPTRELAIQVADDVANYSKHLSHSSMAVYGGVDTEPQKQRLIEGIDILVATPGRLLDLAHQRALYFDELILMNWKYWCSTKPIEWSTWAFTVILIRLLIVCLPAAKTSCFRPP